MTLTLYLFFLAEGRKKVLDFGLAKAFQEQQATTLSNSATLVAASVPGVILGTAAYMSPEQARGKEVDQRSDVFAFGCVLYEMLAGQQAFAGETLMDLIGGMVRVDPNWKAFPPTVPSGIRSLVQRSLEKDRRRCYMLPLHTTPEAMQKSARQVPV